MIQPATRAWRDAHQLTEPEFLSRYRHPALLLDSFASTEVAELATRAGSGDGETERGLVPLIKRTGSNAFGMMITIGRTKNNDVWIPSKDISKFHAYVIKSERGLVFADAGSTFGSFVRGRRLEPRAPLELSPRLELTLSSVRVVFHSPESLRESLLGERVA